MDVCTNSERRNDKNDPWVIKLESQRLKKMLLRALNSKFEKKLAEQSSFTCKSLNLTNSDINNMYPILMYFLNKDGTDEDAQTQQSPPKYNVQNKDWKNLYSSKNLNKLLNLKIDKAEFVQMISDNQNELKMKYNSKSKVIERSKKTYQKFGKISTQLESNKEKYASQLDDGFYLDELCQSYTVPNDSNIMKEIKIYANYHNDTELYDDDDFEEIKDMTSISQKLKFEYDVSYTQQILKIEQKEFNFISESPNQNQISLLSNFDEESFLLPLMPPQNSIILFNYYSTKEEKTLQKKLEVILEFKLQYATRLLVCKIILEDEDEKITLEELKLAKMKSKIDFYTSFFATEIFDMKNGVYDKLYKKPRVDCSNPFKSDESNKCTVF